MESYNCSSDAVTGGRCVNGVRRPGAAGLAGGLWVLLSPRGCESSGGDTDLLSEETKRLICKLNTFVGFDGGSNSHTYINLSMHS